MPRFYFHTRDGDHYVPDEDGLELADLLAARRQAIDALQDMARDGLQVDDERRLAVEVRDHSGVHLLKATLLLKVERP